MLCERGLNASLYFIIPCKASHNLGSINPFHVYSDLRYPDTEDRIFNYVISDISVALGEINPTISDSIETCSPVETEIVSVVSLTTTKITEITQVRKPIFRVRIP